MLLSLKDSHHKLLLQVVSALSAMQMGTIAAPAVLTSWCAALFTHAHSSGLPVSAVRVSTPLSNGQAAGTALFDTLNSAFDTAGSEGFPTGAASTAARKAAARAAGRSRETAVAGMYM